MLRSAPFTPARARGFTLIELMVAAAIVGILAAIAYPSYRAFVVKSNRAAAQSHLMDLAQSEQQYFADSRSYAATVGALNLTTPSNVSSKYTVSIAVDAGPPASFTISATPVAGGPQVADGVLTIDSAGVKTPGTKW
jgi:type IV pilus assembly protein PilE